MALFGGFAVVLLAASVTAISIPFFYYEVPSTDSRYETILGKFKELLKKEGVIDPNDIKGVYDLKRKSEIYRHSYKIKFYTSKQECQYKWREILYSTTRINDHSCRNLPTQRITTAATPTKAATTEAPTTEAPTTEAPTTEAPTKAPTEAPTKAPTEATTQAPTKAPTQAPTQASTQYSTQASTQYSTQAPTEAPTNAPTLATTAQPSTTNAPTQATNRLPPITFAPIIFTMIPTLRPAIDDAYSSSSESSDSSSSAEESLSQLSDPFLHTGL